MEVVTRHDPLTDYAGNRGAGDYDYAVPADTGELQALVKAANAGNQPIRIRGNGHSMNGLAVPRPGELVIAMERFNGLRVDAPGTVVVGAGASSWDAHRTLMASGLELLVYNDGNATASTLGGYLAAGGIGHTCHRFGGFWNTVEEVTLVTGAGALRTVRRGDREFPWLFGSYGQLGIAVEMRLRTQPLSVAATSKPESLPSMVQATHYDWESSAWFTIFAPQPLWKMARSELKQIADRHPSAWKERPPYLYPLPFRDFNPPLIHPHQGALVAVGIWGEAADERGLNWPEIALIDAEVQALLHAHRDYRRYLQCEWISADFDYRAYYGEAIWSRFARLKRFWDPKGLLVPGMPFADEPMA